MRRRRRPRPLAEETVGALPGRVGVRRSRSNVADEDEVKAMYARPPSGSAASTSSTTTPASRRTTTTRSSTRRSTAWERVQDVNTKGVFLCCKHGIPHLLERGGGSVINVASFVAILGAATSQISYTASKGAVLSMSRELAVQFARQGVRVNALCPGPVETPLLLRSSATTRRRSSAAGSTGRWGGSPSRARSSTGRCSSRATSRRT